VITVINYDNATDYKNLFSEAEDILRGYRSVKVFNTEISEYYIKNGDNFESLTLMDGEDLFTKFFDTINGDTERKIPGQPVYVKTESKPVSDSVIRITSLEEYYHWLPYLLDKDADGNKIPNKFAILPLDEAHFTINANTRAINIPDDFKKNGVAVQGDELAEVVYFEIDRFFDAMDLNNCNILIQWETPKGANGIVKGVSKEYVRDIESQPGKLIFGWALDKNITHTSGKLKFSVKFYEIDEIEKDGEISQVIVYSFNTLTANATIHPSIGLNLEDKESYIVSENAAQNLLERLESSVIVGNAKAADPVFLDFPYGNSNIVEGSYDVDEESGTLALFALAYAPDTGNINYDWRMRDLDLDNNLTGSIKTIKYDSEFEYVEVKFDDLKKDSNAKHRNIYQKLDDTFKPLGTGEYVVKNENYKDYELYELKGVLNVNKPGVYSVRAKNRIANSLSSVMSTDFGADKVVVLHRPKDIIMNNAGQTSNMHFIDDTTNILAPQFNDQEPGVCTYRWYQASETVNGAPVINNLASGRVSFTDLPEGAKISYGPNAIRVSVPNIFSSKQYKYLTNPESAPTHPDYKPQKHYATFKI
jgi:hypothetical protein